MANNPFDRTIINLREKPISSDINQLESQLDFALRAVLDQLYSRRTSDSDAGRNPASGFLPGSFTLEAQSSPNMSVKLKAGIGFRSNPSDVPSAISSIIGLDDLSAFKPMVLLADTTLNIAAADATFARYDLIEVRDNRQVTNPNSRLILDPTTGAFNPTSVNKTLAFSLDGSVGTVTSPASSTAAISVKTGVPGAVPVEPAVTPGYVRVGFIIVPAGTTQITQSLITDKRPLLVPGGVVRASINYRLQWNAGTPIVTVKSIVAPPGIKIGAIGSNAFRANSEVAVIGGEITKASVVANVRNPASYSGIDYMALRLRNPLTISGGVPTATTQADTAALAALTPTVVSGYRGTVASVRVEALHITGSTGTADQTSVDLEDLDFYVEFNLGYN